MDLARHLAVLWRFRTITAAGLVLGLLLAVLASYKVTTHGLVQRGVETYQSRSQLLVTQPGFPEGRVVLPNAAVTGSTTDAPKVDPDRLEFADPSRFMALADLYTKLIVSDDVRRRIPMRPAETQLVASPLPAVSGAPILPIIQLDTTADTAADAQKLNTQTFTALRAELEERQARNDISPAQSVRISVLNAPSAGERTAGPSLMGSVLAFLLCVIGTIAVTHLLEALRSRHEAPGFEAIVSDWDAAPGDEDAETPAEEPEPARPAQRGRAAQVR